MASNPAPSVSSGTPTVDLEPIKAREAAAMKGPWVVHRPRVKSHLKTEDGAWVCESNAFGFRRDEDVEFIAHARQDIPKLIAEVERLRAALSALSGQTAPQENETAGEALAVAMLAACEATLRHLWDIAGRFENRQCNQIRDEIHILNKHTLPAIQDAVKVAALSSASTPENEGSEQQQDAR